ncbi:hypothetical protein AXG93_2255s1100 [Marchantia polymorpha subsp. ruderalis]|uniref:Uncharacterized protein n=1 Tax=Marchantia polymorpha subsp. ruderalis TaxID=1480154 RepID=A0A176W727_MARPO|nr:hypothetical protein AXG93_2255s1100 [Marchantia polymorpha subsp. ruderalis]
MRMRRAAKQRASIGSWSGTDVDLSRVIGTLPTAPLSGRAGAKARWTNEVLPELPRSGTSAQYMLGNRHEVESVDVVVAASAAGKNELSVSKM